MGTEMRQTVLVSLCPEGAAFGQALPSGQAGSTRLDSTPLALLRTLCRTLCATIPKHERRIYDPSDITKLRYTAGRFTF